MVGSVVGWVTNVGIVVGSVVGSLVGTVVGTVVGWDVGTSVGSGVGFVVSSATGEITPPPISSADTVMVQTTHSIRIMSIMKNRLFTVSLPVL
jgi:uncharacterized protein YcfJ